jgi:uncharacterized RDD family membrane protein YckC
MNDIYKVVTPENIELNYEVAGIGSRFLAVAIDTLIQGILIVGVFSSLNILKLSALLSTVANWTTSLTGALLICLLFVILIGYYIILETVMNGQTVGKKLVNIRVRREGGYAPTFWVILLRNVIRMIDFLPSFYGFGLIVMFFNKRAKRLGDYAAGTIVVKELPRREIKGFLEGQTASITVPTAESMLIYERYPWLHALLPRITQQDYLLMKNLYKRRLELTNIQSLAKAVLDKLLLNLESVETFVINDKDTLAILTELTILYENQQL